MPLGGLGETQSVPSGRAARPVVASSVAPIALAIGAPCVLATERPSHPDDERRSAKPSETAHMATRNGTFTIVQISDLHCGTQFFLPNLHERAITEANDIVPHLVVCSGDLTTFGFKEEYALARD